jgi:hypothetical protein
VAGRRGRRRKHLLDMLKETRGYWKLKEVTLTRQFWKIRLGKGYGTVIRMIPDPLSPYVAVNVMLAGTLLDCSRGYLKCENAL